MEHSGQLKKPELELLQNPGCLSAVMMTQTKKRKAIETVRGYKNSKYVYKAAVSVLVSKVFEYLIKKNSTYPWVCFFFLRPIWLGNVIHWCSLRKQTSSIFFEKLRFATIHTVCEQYKESNSCSYKNINGQEVALKHKH